MFATIDHAVERMKRLLMQLRAGTDPIEKPGAVDLAAVIRRIERATADQKPALAVETESGVMAECHAERIERVVGHLVQNAREASAEDGKVWIRLKSENGHASLEVGDNGHGMSAEFVRKRLFKPFQTTKAAGMGIGAYESHQYITELGGKIVVDSQPNVGTCVRLLLPLHGDAMRADRGESTAE
jgi:putative PEP-CTERM system histidine kinase